MNYILSRVLDKSASLHMLDTFLVSPIVHGT